MLLKLLFGTFDASKIAVTDPKAKAYAALRGANNADRSKLSMPLYWLRSDKGKPCWRASVKWRGQPRKRCTPNCAWTVKGSGKTFIRDFMQVYTRGDMNVNNIIMIDDAVFSNFAREFDRWIEAINRYLQSNTTRTVFKLTTLHTVTRFN